MKKKILFGIACAISTLSIHAQFVINNGQVVDEKGTLQNEVLFTLESEQSRMFFEQDKIIFALHEISFVENEKSKELIEKGNIEAAKEASMAIKTQRIDLEFLGNTLVPEIIFEEKREEFQNFYLAHCPNGITNVAQYDKVTYRNIYENIDIVFKSIGGQVKYDIILHPGANLADVQFKYNGASSVSVNQNRLIARTALFPLIENMPFSFWQDSKELVDISYVLLGENTFGFQSEGLEITETLVIDPILSWATLFQRTTGGTSSGIRGNVTTDENGNFFHQINTYVADMPLSNPGGVVYYDPSYNPASGLDIYFAKFDVNRTLVWSTYLGGSATSNNFYDHGIRAANNVFYVCGKTESTDFPTVNQGGGAYYELSPGTGSKGFLSKFDITTGQMLHSTYLRCFDYLSMDIDDNGNVAVSSFNYTWSHAPTVLARSGAYNQATHAGNSDIFLYMFDANMNQTWGTFIGGTGYEEPMGVKFDNQNNLYLFNRADNASIPLVDPGNGAFFSNTFYDKYDYWIVKFNTAGELVWSTLYGGNGLEGLSYSQIDVNDANEVILTSTTRSTVMATENPGNGAYFQTTPLGLLDGWGGTGACAGFLMRFDENGVLLHGTYMGSDNEENYIQGQAPGNNGEHYLLLQSRSFSTTPLAGAYNVNNTQPAQYGYLAMQLNSDYGINWSSYVHEDSCFMERMATDLNNGRLYITGTTRAKDFPTTDPGNGAYYDNDWNTGANNAWAIMQFQICSTPNPPSVISGATELCDSETVTYSVTNDPDADSYTWTLPNGWTGTSTTNNITVTSNGTDGIITVVSNNSCGASDEQTLSIEGNVSTSASISETACKTYTSPLGVEYTSSQIINEVLTNAAGCDSTLTIDLTITSPNVTTTNTGMTIMATATGVTYQWLDCDDNFAVITGEVNQSFTATEDGSYAVAVTENGCTDTSACVTVSTVGLTNFDNSGVSIYPNPSTGLYTISGIKEKANLRVFNTAGQLILSHELNILENQLDLTRESRGVYFIEIDLMEGTLHKKLTKY